MGFISLLQAKTSYKINELKDIDHPFTWIKGSEFFRFQTYTSPETGRHDKTQRPINGCV